MYGLELHASVYQQINHFCIVSDPRLKAALAAIEKYLRDNCGTQTVKLWYKDYTNGTSLTSEDTTFAVSLVILTTAGGNAHLPDNVLLLGGVASTNDVKWLTAELRKFINFPMQLCPQESHPAPRLR